MSRLIDVDKLLESLKTEPQYFIQAPRSYKSIMNMISNHHKKVIEVIEQQPTAFDANKLLERLEKKRKECNKEVKKNENKGVELYIACARREGVLWAYAEVMSLIKESVHSE